jgi:hypothetical protein
MAATLDGLVDPGGAVFEAKFMLPWTFSEEAAAENLSEKGESATRRLNITACWRNIVNTVGCTYLRYNVGRYALCVLSGS